MDDLGNRNHNHAPPNSSHDQHSPDLTPGLSRPQSISKEEIIRLHRFPPILSRLHEADVVKLAYACKVRNALADTMNMAKRQYRQVILAARSYEIYLLDIQNKLQEADDGLGTLVGMAVRSASSGSAINGIPDGAHPCPIRSTRLHPSSARTNTSCRPGG
jgi:hypothetical protein